MPYLTVYTNVEVKNGAEIAEKAAELTASILRKPVAYVVTNFLYNNTMAFGGKTQNKGALVELKSIGLGDKDKVVAELTTFFSKELNIKNLQYINISLVDIPASLTAASGRTFG